MLSSVMSRLGRISIATSAYAANLGGGGGILPQSSLLAPVAGAVHLEQVRLRHTRKDQRQEFFILRDPPVGPHKRLPPNVRLHGRVGPNNIDYHKIIHWPEDGKYTIEPLKITKLGGRDPVTGHKVIRGVGGGYKRR